MAYQTLEGAKIPVKVWVDDLADVESSALDQLRNTANLPWVEAVSVMPDVHYGRGATIGSVIQSRGAVSPAVVGVDIGCVDADTEFLTPRGWKSIAEWQAGDKVLTYNRDTDTAYFETPIAYINKPCDEMYRIHTKYGVDLLVDGEHRHLVFKYDRSYSFSVSDVVTTKELVEDHERLANGYRHRFLTSFKYRGGGEFLTPEELRVMVMVCADGHFVKRHAGTMTCCVSVKKARKVERAAQLLTAAGIKFTQKMTGNGCTKIRFIAPFRTKTLSVFWGLDADSLNVIADESFHWDGNLKDLVYFTRDKASADFMHFCYSATGRRGVMREDLKDGVPDYRVFAHENVKVGINGAPEKIQIERVPSPDGRKYCFTVETGFFVIRRGGNIMVTGNCGMAGVKTPYRTDDMKDLATLRHSIERSVPVGFNCNKAVSDRSAFFLQQLGPYSGHANKLMEKAALQLGSLGGGNHFIEICTDTDGFVWVLLHSGSRNIGKSLAEVHIGKAKGLVADMVKKYDQEFDPELAALAMGTPEYNEYIFDLLWCQRYAKSNRDEMMLRVLKDLSFHMKGEDVGPQAQTLFKVQCHHNYIEYQEDDAGPKLITRKGAVSARNGEFGIIPGSMGTRSYIVRGRGNADSMCSCSHGAGRRMSRGAARRAFTVDDLAKQTEGVECRKDGGVLDEIPGAYKDVDQVMRNQADLVEVVATLKALVCVKG